MRNVHSELGKTLIDIECEMRQKHLWQTESPSSVDLASEQPFCVDTLTFTEWLQFVFLPRMYELVHNEETLPERSDITPMAEEYFVDSLDSHHALLRLLHRVDRLLNSTRDQPFTPTS